MSIAVEGLSGSQVQAEARLEALGIPASEMPVRETQAASDAGSRSLGVWLATPRFGLG